MATEAPRVTYTPAEYLARERVAETKSEYLNGEILAMTGASIPHNYITLNLGGELRQQLRGKGCSTFVNDVRVRVCRTGLYTYPDVMVVCGPLSFDDDRRDTILNPIVIVEVLSPTTEAYDRGEKFRQYRRLESLREYVLVAQDTAHIERYVRQGDLWVLSEMTGLDAVLSLEAVDCTVPLATIYEQVELPSETPVATADNAPGVPGQP
jgi:Uma2 family endonuclease